MKLSTMRIRAALPLIALVTCVAVLPQTAAWAQPANTKAQPLTPPTPPSGNSGDGAGFLAYAFGIVLAGAMLGVCFFPSKRGHQD
ncbi:MAG: hypothetical protein JSR72_23425 [Proteobacteria bacterium]|nr:hypothetical protein [Pseudomonadota bacterium]